MNPLRYDLQLIASWITPGAKVLELGCGEGDLLLYGDLIKAPEALFLGLVNKVVPKEDLEDQALAWAADLAQKSPIAVRIAKTAFYRSEDLHYEARFAYMNEAFARLCTTDDAKEGVSAFFEKRAPQWQEK